MTPDKRVEEIITDFQKKDHIITADGGLYVAVDAHWLRTTLHHQLQKVRKEERWRIWGELCDLAEPDERQSGAGDLNTHLDDVHKIIFTKNQSELDRLTSDNK